MVILSLGSNLSSKFGDRFDTLKYAISLLRKHKIEVDKKSNFYETLSYPDNTNPKFINMVISVRTTLPIHKLMTLLISIEESLERIRDKKNAPRTCDIDILDYNNKVLEFKYKDSDFKVPHKDLTLRNFVLIPLQEILPSWKHPKTRVSIEKLIQNLSEEDRKSILKIKKN